MSALADLLPASITEPNHRQRLDWTRIGLYLAPYARWSESALLPIAHRSSRGSEFGALQTARASFIDAVNVAFSLERHDEIEGLRVVACRPHRSHRCDCGGWYQALPPVAAQAERG